MTNENWFISYIHFELNFIKNISIVSFNQNLLHYFLHTSNSIQDPQTFQLFSYFDQLAEFQFSGKKTIFLFGRNVVTS